MFGVQFFSKILFAFVVGITCAAVWIKYDERFLAIAQDAVITVFREQYGARFCAQEAVINPFSLSLTFHNPHIEPLDTTKQWRWGADELTLSCNLLSYLYSRVIGLSAVLKNVIAYTGVKNDQIAIVEHIQSMFSEQKTEIPLDFNGLSIDRLQLDFEDIQNRLQGCVASSLSAGKQDGSFVTTITCLDGDLMWRSLPYIRDLRGSVVVEADGASMYPFISFDCSCTCPQLPDEKRYAYFAKGSWNGTTGSCIAHTQDHSLQIHPCIITRHANAYAISAELTVQADIVKRIMFPTFVQELEGSCAFTISGSTAGGMQGTCKGKQLAYGGYTCDNCTISFMQQDDDIEAVVHADMADRSIDGTVSWSLASRTGSCALKNSSAIPMYGYWELPAQKAELTGAFSFNKESEVCFDYRALVHHAKTEEDLTLNGSVVYHDQNIMVRGSLASQLYTLEMQTDPFMITSALYTDKDGNELIKGSFSDPSHFTAIMHYETVRTLARSWFDSVLPGQGICTFSGEVDKQKITGNIQLSHALIRLPGMYNFVSSGAMRYVYDLPHDLIIFHDIDLVLHKGSVKSKRITVRTPGVNKKLFLHVPVNFNHCFINWRKQLYGTFSGSLLYACDSNRSDLSGFCIVESMNVKDNIFASELYNSFGGASSRKKNDVLSATDINIGVSTAQSVSITTPVLETKAQLTCKIKNTLQEPVLDGALQLKGGKILFPAYPLTITRGKITFVPYQNNDHQLDIVAQGRIKKYLITMMIGGSVQDPSITLQASPSLTQEQVMMLLFGGTEEQSLNVMAPALVMYNAQNFLFSQSSQYDTVKDALMPSWLQPFQRISFIPRFTDQTGRGGLKGVVEVEVNDRLRAAIEKNFSLSENASAEVEYLLSDDVSLKMSKDDRGDMGAELEMRFKF